MEAIASNTARKESLTDNTSDRNRLGIDAKGRSHHVDTVSGLVWVVADGDIAHVEETREVARWVRYTDANVGWDSCNYSDEPFGEWLARALSGGV